MRKRQRVLICVHLALTADLSPSRRSPQHWKEGKGLSSHYFLCWKAPHLPAVLFPQHNSLRLKCFPEQRKWTESSGSSQEGTQRCQRSHPVPLPPTLSIHFSSHRDFHSLPTHEPQALALCMEKALDWTLYGGGLCHEGHSGTNDEKPGLLITDGGINESVLNNSRLITESL